MMLRNTLIFLSESNAAKAVVTKTPLRHMSTRFVPGETVEDFLRAAAKANEMELEVTGNYLGESEHDERTAQDAVNAYLQILDGIVEKGVKGNISVKPTQVGLEIGKEFIKENLRQLLDRAREAEVFIRWDMESSDWTQATLDPFEELWAEGYQNMGVVLQSYLRRTMDDAKRMNELGVRVRLCRSLKLPPSSRSPPAAIVSPVPPWVPACQVIRPWTVKAPGPARTPPGCRKLPVKVTLSSSDMDPARAVTSPSLTTTMATFISSWMR